MDSFFNALGFYRVPPEEMELTNISVPKDGNITYAHKSKDGLTVSNTDPINFPFNKWTNYCGKCGVELSTEKGCGGCINKGKTILLWGGAGYLGATLTNILLESGYRVIVYDNMHKGSADSLIPFITSPNFQFRFGDVTNEIDVKKSFEGEIDYLVNMAAIVGFPASARNPSLSRAVNVGGMANLMKYKPDHVKTVFTSTGSVFGALGETCTELSPTNPTSFYGLHKLEAEKICLTAKNTKIHRYSTAAGVGFNTTRINLLVNTLVYESIINKCMTVFEGEFKRSFINCLDICRAIIHTLENFDNYKHRIYCVGNPEMNYSKREIAEKIAQKTGAYLTLAEVGKDADARNYAIDFSRILSEGWKPTIDMDQTIDDLIKITPMLTSFNRYN